MVFIIIFPALILLVCYVCYRMAFYAPPRKPADPGDIPLPEGEEYAPYRDKMTDYILQARALPREDISITSFDGLTLWGSFYEYAPGAPIELMFHGYRGSAERDLSGGIQRCFRVGRSALVVDQRCSGRSQGKAITFGVREHRDCLAWLAYMQKCFGPQQKILLTGISMGASTVLMAGGADLPQNVIGILADCGFTSAKEIICHVIRTMGLPPRLCYPFVRLGSRLYAGFDPEEYSALEAVKQCRVPVIFYHGESDDFVPCEMSIRNYEACAARKRLVLIPGAAHGLSYPADPQRYLAELRDFFGPEASFGGKI